MPAALPPNEDKPGVDMPPPLYFLAPFFVFLIVEWFVPTTILGRPWNWVAGGALAVAGLAIIGPAAVAQKRAGTNFEPDKPTTAIVTTGVYARTRNPMYVGFASLTTGLAVGFDSWWALAAVPLGIALVQTQVIAREERYLERKFGEQYLAYKKRVRRWF